jgi:3',5'-cyclic-AMP phosphodiesterase
MRIIHLTDQHIGMPGVAPYGQDVRSNFLRALQDVLNYRPDLLVLGGDLCLENGNREIYYWIKDNLRLTRLPYYIVPGNHDDNELLQEVFGLVGTYTNELYFSIEKEGHELIFLDSHSAKLSDSQWLWLEQKLIVPAPFHIIFMHHPPVESGIYHMDTKYPFLEQDRFINLVKTASAPVFIFSGHYHCEKTVLRENIAVFITPSTYFQIDGRVKELTILPSIPGYRIIDISEDVLYTKVFWLEE